MWCSHLALFQNFSGYLNRFAMPEATFSVAADGEADDDSDGSDDLSHHYSSWAAPSPAPSGTNNLWNSYDHGGVHFLAYSTEHDLALQLDFIKEDLTRAAANRASVPWIVMYGHRPVYWCVGMGPCGGGGDGGGGWFARQLTIARGAVAVAVAFGAGAGAGALGAAAAAVAVAVLTSSTDDANDCKVNGPQKLGPALEPLMREFGVDLYLAGHLHNYERSYPVFGGSVVSTSYDKPNATVHVVVGMAGDVRCC